jgi:HEAT repeat protein
MREGREAVARALVTLGPPALKALRAVVSDRDSPRAQRAHFPSSIARFGTREAANVLLDVIETDADGLVRYKAIRALGQLVDATRLRVDRLHIESLALASLKEHFRVLGLRSRLDATPWYRPSATERRAPTEMLLIGLLDDKLRQSLQRAFRLLRIANPREDLHRVHNAYLSDNRRARAAAAEFLDTMLRRSKQALLREAAGSGRRGVEHGGPCRSCRRHAWEPAASRRRDRSELARARC